MGAAAGDGYAADRRGAAAAGQAGALVDAVFHLEKSGFAGGIDVIGDGGSTQADGVMQDLAQCEAEALEISAGEAAGHAAGADSGAEEAFVGVDIADAGEEALVKEGGLDGSFSFAEERGEIFRGDGEGLETGGQKCRTLAEVFVRQATETAGIDEAEFAAAGECDARVGVRRDGRGGIGDEQAAGHAEVHDPLGFGSWIGGT